MGFHKMASIVEMNLQASGPSENGAERVPSDAFVFFGASGDLAYKKIFPARMVRRGVIDVPVIGGCKIRLEA